MPPRCDIMLPDTFDEYIIPEYSHEAGMDVTHIVHLFLQ